MKNSFIAFVLLSGCAATRMQVPPPNVQKLECQVIESEEMPGVIGFLCSKESVQKFSDYLDRSIAWQNVAWKVCGPKK